jgi:hypothetical protein
MPIKPERNNSPILEFLKWQKDGILDLRPPFSAMPSGARY